MNKFPSQTSPRQPLQVAVINVTAHESGGFSVFGTELALIADFCGHPWVIYQGLHFLGEPKSAGPWVFQDAGRPCVQASGEHQDAKTGQPVA